MKEKKFISKIKRYGYAKYSRLGKIRLDKNEKIDKFKKNFFNNFKKNINSSLITAYPEVYPLIKKISKKYKISEKNIFLTSGIDNGIKLIIDAYTNKGDDVLILKPTFAMTKIYCDLANLKIIEIGYNEQLEINLKKLLNSIKPSLKLIIISNPNSPTGTIIKENILIKIIKKSKKNKIPVIIDEAYFGFYKKTLINKIKRYKNLFVLRTFSKAFGLAGLRSGFIASSSSNIKYLYKFKPMYEMNSIAILASKILISNTKEVNRYVSETLKSKKKLIKILNKLKLNFFDTNANFILINFGYLTKTIIKTCKRKNILLSNNSPIKNYLRITLGPLKDMRKFFKILTSTYN